MIFLLVNNVKITNFDIMIKLYTDKLGMMDGHGQFARKNDGPRALPVARVCPFPSCPFLKKVTLPVFAREFCSGNCPRLKVTMKCYLKIR